MSEFISVNSLAEELGRDRSHFRRLLKKWGTPLHKHRIDGNGGAQTALVVSAEDAEIVRAKFDRAGFIGASTAPPLEFGHFYVAALCPDLDPRRIKLGYADEPFKRLREHQTSAPTAIMLAYFHSRRSWESAAISALTVDCQLIASECFLCPDVPALLKRAQKLFDLLPSPHERPALADCSPLRASPESDVKPRRRLKPAVRAAMPDYMKGKSTHDQH
jgi:hypothetical protein